MDGREARTGEMSKKSYQRLKRYTCVSSIFRSTMIMAILMVAHSSYSTNFVAAEEPKKYDGLYLNGIGYREQELQLAKGTNFESEEANGVKYVSFAGGTHIFIKGIGLNFAPEKNSIRLTSHEKSVSFIAPALTEEDQFNSHPQLGTISYRIPSIAEIFQGIPES